MFTTFAYTLGGGMLATLATGRHEELPRRLINVISLIVFALAFLVLAWDVRESGWSLQARGGLPRASGTALAVAALATALIRSAGVRLKVTSRLICGLGGLAGVVAACASALAICGRSGPASPYATAIVVSGQVAGAFLLGSITIAWLLGHAYLTASGLSIAPLRHFCRLLVAAVVLRTLFVPASIAIAWVVGRHEVRSILDDMLNAWFVISLRVGVGLLPVGLFAYMVADCVRIRSTRSATGILYFGSIFTYVGELASQQIVAECGWAV
ncbi:MAG: hypothetical protein ACE5HE_02335 [Phycisphaerae bacterium]